MVQVGEHSEVHLNSTMQDAPSINEKDGEKDKSLRKFKRVKRDEKSLGREKRLGKV